jgi:hypothetical protein
VTTFDEVADQVETWFAMLCQLEERGSHSRKFPEGNLWGRCPGVVRCMAVHAVMFACVTEFWGLQIMVDRLFNVILLWDGLRMISPIGCTVALLNIEPLWPIICG